ncbi:er lumen protein retaining receptor [Stylonychia lemnae]|uniref:Er lumen protein retaining receptor n=1 Tax=Stylonychia lemnae TaxID=5949 RepID=A0A078ANW4_STYLE|nr:er lumen protein retaining receptor [Stylonychia lemnae]|eukprot:CDW83844.1 er lumen protein retaining receptor [Stylonychia lemnae]
MYGVSIDTQICLMFAAVARVLWMWDTQLTKLTISMIEIILAVGMHAYIIFLCYQYKDTIYKGIKEKYLKSPVLILACAVFSVILHPGTKGDFFFTLQMLVSFTIFLEAVALIPQLLHLRQNRDPEGLTSTYLYCLGGSRSVRFFFWIAMITNNDTFWYLILADLIHTFLLIGFFYLYRQTLKSGGGPILAFTDKKQF